MRRVTELGYRVTRDSNEVYLVEVAYADLMNAFPPRAESMRDPKERAAPGSAPGYPGAHTP